MAYVETHSRQLQCMRVYGVCYYITVCIFICNVCINM